jgi:hypothetical protein
MMTSRERVWTSIRHSQPDRVSYYFSPSQHMPGDIPVENMLASIEAVRG